MGHIRLIDGDEMRNTPSADLHIIFGHLYAIVSGGAVGT